MGTDSPRQIDPRVLTAAFHEVAAGIYAPVDKALKGIVDLRRPTPGPRYGPMGALPLQAVIREVDAMMERHRTLKRKEKFDVTSKSTNENLTTDFKAREGQEAPDVPPMP